MKYAALPLVVIDVKALLYTRYWGIGQKTVYRAQREISAADVETLRLRPNVFCPSDAGAPA